jgi:hypothetical protein
MDFQSQTAVYFCVELLKNELCSISESQDLSAPWRRSGPIATPFGITGGTRSAAHVSWNQTQKGRSGDWRDMKATEL